MMNVSGNTAGMDIYVNALGVDEGSPGAYPGPMSCKAVVGCKGCRPLGQTQTPMSTIKALSILRAVKLLVLDRG